MPFVRRIKTLNVLKHWKPKRSDYGIQTQKRRRLVPEQAEPLARIADSIQEAMKDDAHDSVSPAVPRDVPPPPDIALVQRTIQAEFPNLWTAVDVGLSTCATLLLKDNVNCTAVVYVGSPSCGKTTVVPMFG
jgi:hypothetical protein